jgi:hypothetical protein
MIDPELFKQLQLLGQAQSLRNQQASLKTQQEIVKALKEKADKEEKEKKERADKEQKERRDVELRQKELEKEIERLRRVPSEVLRPATPIGPHCPHCGGNLPLSGGCVKEWTACKHCARDLLWCHGKPFASQRDAELHAVALQKKQEELAAGALFAGFDTMGAHLLYKKREKQAAFATSKPIPLGTCLYACAVLVAADGKATAAELGIVRSGLEWCGLEQSELQAQFVEACRRPESTGTAITASLHRTIESSRYGRP